MPNNIHSLLPAASNNVYALGSEKSFLLTDAGDQLKDSESYGRTALSYGSGATYGTDEQSPMPLWTLTKAVLQTSRAAGTTDAQYQLKLRGYTGTESQLFRVVAVTASTVTIWHSYGSATYTIPAGQWTSTAQGIQMYRSADLVPGSEWTFYATFWKAPTRVTGFLYEGQTFVAGRGTALHQLSGRVAWPIAQKYGDFLFEMSNHAFLLLDNRLSWSNAYDFGHWTPGTEHNADSYTFRGETGQACGAEPLGDNYLIIYPNNAYLLEYVGKPSVMRIRKIAAKLGSVLQGSVVQHSGMIYYITFEGIWVFDGQQRQNISGRVWQEISDQVNKTKLTKVWTYVSEYTNEIVWVFMSAGSSVYDRAVAFNHVEQSWSFYDFPNTTAYIEQMFAATKSSIADLVGKVGDLSGPIEDLGSALQPTVIIGSQDQVLIEMTDSDDTSLAVDTISETFLESADIYYGDLQHHKDIDLVMIDADYDDDCLGIDVYVSAREFRSQPVEWTLLGRWDKNSHEQHLDFAEIVAGKVFRFKFVAVGSTNGLRALTFYAWGERVDLPTQIGPDK